MKGEVNILSWYMKCSMGKLVEGVRMAGNTGNRNAVEQRAFGSEEEMA